MSGDGTAIVLGVERATEDGAHVVNVRADPGGGNNDSLDHFTPPGVDALPLPGDAAALASGAGTGVQQTTGYNDPKNEGRAKPGEVRVYGRDPDGNVVNEVWFQGSGDVIIENAEGGIRIAPDGTVTINGVTFSPQGEIKAPLEISAMNAAVPVKLSTHTHLSGTGPTSPPTPGT